MPTIEVHGKGPSWSGTEQYAAHRHITDAFKDAPYADALAVLTWPTDCFTLRGNRAPFLRVWMSKKAREEYGEDFKQRIESLGWNVDDPIGQTFFIAQKAAA